MTKPRMRPALVLDASAGRARIGTTLVVLGSALATFWGYWGVIENFHEGWYYERLDRNVGLMFVQYLWPMLAFQTATALSVLRPRVGAAGFLAMAVGAAWRFRGASALVVVASIVGPLLVLASCAFWGRVRRPRIALVSALAVPMGVVVVVGAPHAQRVSQRVDDGLRGIRETVVAGVRLEWAPAGPGWPSEGVTWHEATRRARFLSPDGLSLDTVPRDRWRLPTIGEAVASQHRHGRPAGGRWDPLTQRATYTEMPDKETPLWDPHSKVVYWWTATGPDSARAFRISYAGHVLAVPKQVRWGYLGFRAVRVSR